MWCIITHGKKVWFVIKENRFYHLEINECIERKEASTLKNFIEKDEMAWSPSV